MSMKSSLNDIFPQISYTTIYRYLKIYIIKHMYGYEDVLDINDSNGDVHGISPTKHVI